MPTRYLVTLLALILAACAAPTATPSPEPQPTLPPPAAETVVATQPDPEPAPTQVASTEIPPSTVAPTEAMAKPVSLPFVKMEVTVGGSATLDSASNTLQFSNDFVVLPGPDLYVILSGAHDLSLDYTSFSQTVTDAPILYLGELAAVSGPQSYTVAADTDLSQYNTVVIWCKQYSVAFAAAALK